MLHLEAPRQLDARASAVGGDAHVCAARQHQPRQLHVVVVNRVVNRSESQRI